MKLEREFHLAAPREEVFRALLDPEVLRHCTPGCEDLRSRGEGVYQAALRVGVGPVRGKFTGSVTVRDPRPPERMTLEVEARGLPGGVRGSGTLTLAEAEGGTTLHCAGEARVTGALASVGSRVVGAAADRMMEQFFRALEERLRSRTG